MKKIIFLFLLVFLLFSCARVGSPVGGDKDTIPPNVIGTNIDTSRVNVPRDIRELRIDFDEYITLKEYETGFVDFVEYKIPKSLFSGIVGDIKIFPIVRNNELGKNVAEWGPWDHWIIIKK